MAEITLVAEPGRATGTPESKRLRATGRIPAVVYGQGGAATAVSVDARELRVALSGDAGTNQLLDLRVGAAHHLSLARVLQRHPVRNTVVHVDFQIVRRDEVISVEVPIVVIGESKAIVQSQGVVEQVVLTLLVQSNPGNIPNELTVDITDLQIGDTVRVSDLRLPVGVATEVDLEEAVLIVAGSSVAAEVEELQEEEAAEAAEAAAEAAEADPAAREGGAEEASGGDGGAEG